MKLMFISDIHGSYYYLKQAITAYQNEKPDRLILLGDLLYHGPRNDLPKDYAPKKVIPILNELKNNIIAVRGNCDAEVDQMVLDFPIMADYVTIDVDGIHFFLTHGHLFDEEHLPNLNPGDVFVYGHIHKPVAKKIGDIYVLNPSSISLPKAGNCSYGIYEQGRFMIKEFDQTIVEEIEIKDK